MRRYKREKRTKHTVEAEEVIIEETESTIQVTELIPLGSPANDNMKTIADMTDQFAHTIDPILRMYNAAMSEATARLEIIKDEFSYRNQRCPIHHIDTRLKSAGSILGKLEKKNLELTLTAACNNIYDIAGVRIVCPYIKDVYLIRDRILAQDDLHILEIKDYIESPKQNGYRSLHIIIRIPVYFMNKKQLVPVELQLRSLAMDLWASLEHDIRYKTIQTSKQKEIDFSHELFECSELIYQAEEKMSAMNAILES